VHSLSRTINSIIGAGFELVFLHEWDYTLYEELKWLKRGDDGRYSWPGPGTLPLMYSLKARKRPNP
jgi:hypothetical protein